MQRLLRAVADSDGKTINVLRRASLSRSGGHQMLHALESIGLLYKEASREALPSKRHRKKEERGYTIQAKIKFVHPFYRFWYTFVAPHAREIERGNFHPFYEQLDAELDRYVSFTFEELANALIAREFAEKDPLKEQGTYWDRHNEFDLLARTDGGSTIVGECKWKGHKICKSLVSKLRSKCERSGLSPDYYALFSRNGFSKELENIQDCSLLRFDLEDFERLLA
jgi:AAA+ ATPase superfamily predicted ATPase